MIPPDVFTVEEVKVEPYFDLRKIGDKTEIHPVNGIYVFVVTGLITIDASQSCFEPLVVNNQDNFEFQFSATQIQVKWSRPEVLLLLSLYRDREQLFKDTKTKKKILWEEVPRDMRQQCYEYTGSQCETKLENV